MKTALASSPATRRRVYVPMTPAQFLLAVLAMGVVVVGSWFAQVPASLVLGIFAAGRQRYRSWFTTVYFLPLLISAASLGVLWTNLLSPLGGGIQYAARHWGLGLLDRQWLGDPNLVMWAVIALIAWEFIPFGGGFRRCIGAAFAIYEMKMVLASLFRRLHLRMAPGYTPRFVRRAITITPAAGLPVEIIARSPQHSGASA